jgi:hypothetical protein
MAKTHMSIAEFLKTPEWARLSVNQKFWVRSYLESDDPILAAQMSYPDVALYNIRTFSYKVLGQAKIKAALNRYFNRSERDIYLAGLERDIRRAKGAAKLKLQMRFAELKFGKSKRSKSHGKKTHHA